MGKQRAFLFFEMVNAIREQIEQGTLTAGTKLKTEREYQEQFRISRVTVRRALQELVSMNYVEHRPNKGYFVSLRFRKTEITAPSAYKHLTAWGFTIESKILEMMIVPAGEEMALRMKCMPEDELIMIYRVRYADQKPFATQRIWLRQSMFPQLNPWLLVKDSLRRIMEEVYGCHVESTQEEIEACMPDEDVTALLNIKSKIPIIHIKTTAFNSLKEICEYSETFFTTDQFVFAITT